MGIEGVMEVLPFTSKSEASMNDTRAWLLPIMIEKGKRHPSSLKFFHTTILEIARKCGAIVSQEKVRMTKVEVVVVRGGGGGGGCWK